MTLYPSVLCIHGLNRSSRSLLCPSISDRNRADPKDRYTGCNCPCTSGLERRCPPSPCNSRIAVSNWFRLASDSRLSYLARAHDLRRSGILQRHSDLERNESELLVASGRPAATVVRETLLAGDLATAGATHA